MTNSEAIEVLKANYPDPCFELLRDAVDTAIYALSAQPEHQWISCSERLPTKPGRYLVTQKIPYGMRVTIAYFDWNEFWDEAVAWMPLPEPYKENKDASI